MSENLRLLCVVAHPDDESLGAGGVLARYAGEGIETFLVTATRGERGRLGAVRPGAAVMAPLRERELRCAAAVLGIREVCFLDYVDGDLDRADPAEATARIVRQVRRIRPQVVLTFGPDGAYGHPDHIAISQLTGAALVAAADPDYQPPDGDARQEQWRVSKLYWMVHTDQVWAPYQEAFGELKVTVDGVVRRAEPWQSWAVTTVVDTAAQRETVWSAVRCHNSQISTPQKLADLDPELRTKLWATQEFYRVFSAVNGGREVETDLFEGLR